MSDAKLKASQPMRTVSLVVEIEDIKDYTVRVRVNENDAKSEEHPHDLIIWVLWTPLPNASGENTGDEINYEFTFTFDKDRTEWGTLAWDGGFAHVTAPHWKRVARHAYGHSRAIRNEK